jgi:outer membrane receptor protein involved in Fe transport
VRTLSLIAIAASALAARAALAQTAPAQPPPPPAPPAPAPAEAPPAAPAQESPRSYETVVTPTTPLHGSKLPLDHVPANVRSVTAEELAEHHSLDISTYMGEAVGSVNINNVQANPLQPDLQYRGFLASPLLGAAQGLSLYLDGVRLNEPFGDTINWDLLPTNAIRSVNIMPGSNPIFGLNTLGGALSLESKDGFSDPGLDAATLYGSWNRKLFRANGGAHTDRWGFFAAAEVFDEDGWRQVSPSRAERAFLSGSYRDTATRLDLTLSAASTHLTGNGPAPLQLLAVDRTAIFTTPDTTANQLLMATLRAERALAPHARLSAIAYVRTNGTKTANGDRRDWSDCKATAGVLCSVGDSGMETPVLDASGAPVPFMDKYDAAFNRTFTRQTSYGVTAQLAGDAPLAGHESHLFVGADVAQSRLRFRSSTTVGELDDNRDTIDDGFLDPTSPIAVDSVVDDLGLYASETFSFRRDLHLVVSGRLNVSSLSLEDQLGDALTGKHTYSHLNPAVGLSYQPRRELGVYGNLSQSNRAPTAIELTCASPDDPCRLPNAFLSDPPLAQVVATTAEGGLRGSTRRGGLRLTYDLTYFWTRNSNDIAFISSGMVANQGYFANVGDTRRQGIEADLTGSQRVGAGSLIEWGLHYTWIDAQFESPFTALSATHPDAVNGSIDVPAGAHIPSIPQHLGKASLTYLASFGLMVGVNVVAESGQYYRGDEANLLPQVPGFVVVNTRVAYQIVKTLSVFVLADNVFDARYSTFGVLGNATAVLPGYDDVRFQGPGAPRAGWAGMELHY